LPPAGIEWEWIRDSWHWREGAGMSISNNNRYMLDISLSYTSETNKEAISQIKEVKKAS